VASGTHGGGPPDGTSGTRRVIGIGFRPRLAGWLGCWLVAASGLARAEPAAGGSPAAADLAAWIGQLGAAQYAQREAAARHLAAAGRPAIPALGTAITGDDFEVASRSVEIVRGMLGADDAELAAEAEGLLERVATADASAIGGLAQSALEFHQIGMAAAARERLESRGALFRDRRSTAGERGLEVEFNAAWQGGPDDWRLLPRLRDVTIVSVHGVSLDAAAVAVLGRLAGVRRIDLFGTAAPEEAVATLVARLPEVGVDVRKGGRLGVSSIVQAGPCELSAVQPGSAADKAGLRAGDVIVAADDQAVASFAALTAWLAQRAAGEEVRLAVERNAAGGPAERLECTARLDAW
jgi:hypothetical protein